MTRAMGSGNLKKMHKPGESRRPIGLFRRDRLRRKRRGEAGGRWNRWDFRRAHVKETEL